MLWKRSCVLVGIGITFRERERGWGLHIMTTIARGEIDSTDRCQASVEPLIVLCQIPFFIIPDCDVSLSQHPSSMPLRRLLPLLSCPLCAAANRGSGAFPLLRNPFTLHCGHTVCSSHLPTLDHTQRCPLPVCPSAANTNTARPNIPSSSTVIYYPATPPPPSSHQTTTTPIDQYEQLVDITVSKLLDVVSRHSPPPPRASDLEDSDRSDGDDEHEQPVGPSTARVLPNSIGETEFRVTRGMRRSSGRRRRPAPESTLPSTSISTSVISADSVQDALPTSPGHAGYSTPLPPRPNGGEISDGSDSSPEPPKKRLRCDSRALVTDQQTQSFTIETASNSDNANNPEPIQPNSEPHQDPNQNVEDLRARVDKELLTELSCEICFAIYYQPVTTPCQHVSRLFPFFSRTFDDLSCPPPQPIIRPGASSGCFHSHFQFFGNFFISPISLEDVLWKVPSEVFRP